MKGFSGKIRAKGGVFGAAGISGKGEEWKNEKAESAPVQAKAEKAAMGATEDSRTGGKCRTCTTIRDVLAKMRCP